MTFAAARRRRAPSVDATSPPPSLSPSRPRFCKRVAPWRPRGPTRKGHRKAFRSLLLPNPPECSLVKPTRNSGMGRAALQTYWRVRSLGARASCELLKFIQCVPCHGNRFTQGLPAEPSTVTEGCGWPHSQASTTISSAIGPHRPPLLLPPLPLTLYRRA